MGGGGEAARDQSAEPGADHAAEAEGGMEARHHGAPERGDQIDRGAVHRHVHPAVRGAEDQQYQAERERRTGLRGQGDGEGEQNTADHGHRMAAEASARSRPVSIMVTTAPADTPSRARPRVVAEAPVWCLMAGMRTTQPHEEEAVEGEEHGQGGTEAGRRRCGGVSARSPR